MKRKLLCLILTAALLLSALPVAHAASPAVRAANALYTLGLFQGVGQHSDGSPIYALNRSLTRQEAVVLLIRLLGLEQTALTADPAAATSFVDVADWAAPYVSLARQQGYVRGVDDTHLDADTPVDEQAWLTMLLRALGYADASYDDPWTLAATIGLTDGAADADATFTRASAVTLSLTALGLPCSGGTDTLLAMLLAAQAVTAREIADAGLTDALTRRSLSAAEVSARCADAVFYLQMYANETAYQTGTLCANASGFFIAPDGVALTNYHAVGGSMYAVAITNDGRCYQVREVLYADEQRDIAVLRLDPTVIGTDGQLTGPTGEVTATFPYLTMRGADTVVNGDIVYAIGSPLGLTNSISDGIVANRSRLVEAATGSPDPYLQVTAAISSGSSGGVLLNEYGEAIGITTATFAYGQNLNLAVPLDVALSIDLTAAGEPYETSFGAEPSPYGDIAMYEQYPSVPDFGALIGAELLGFGETSDGCFYLYDNALATEDALLEYYQAMLDWGFTYAYDLENFQMVFTSESLGLSVYGVVVTQEVDGEELEYYQIRIAEHVADTTALRPDAGPWG